MRRIWYLFVFYIHVIFYTTSYKLLTNFGVKKLFEKKTRYPSDMELDGDSMMWRL